VVWYGWVRYGGVGYGLVRFGMVRCGKVIRIKQAPHVITSLPNLTGPEQGYQINVKALPPISIFKVSYANT